MGSLESGICGKRDHQSLLRSSSATGRSSFNERNQNAFCQRIRSRFARFCFFRKINYFWFISVAALLFFFVVWQMKYLGPEMENSGGFLKPRKVDSTDLAFLKEFNGLDFGEDIKFEPSKILAKFQKEAIQVNGSRNVLRFGYRKPKLAMVSSSVFLYPVVFGFL